MDNESTWLLYVDPNKAFSIDPGSLSYFSRNFVGLSMAATWVAPPITFSDSRRMPKDFVSWMPGAPVVSDEAKSVIEQVAEKTVEFLPLFVHRGKAYYAMNVIRESTNLDTRASDIEYLDEDSTEIMMVRSAVFNFCGAVVPPAFKIKGYAGDVYVSHAFARAIRNAALSGAVFLDPRKELLPRVLRNDVTDDFEIWSALNHFGDKGTGR